MSPGQTGRIPGGVPPKFLMFIGFFLSPVSGSLLDHLQKHQPSDFSGAGSIEVKHNSNEADLDMLNEAFPRAKLIIMEDYNDQCLKSSTSRSMQAKQTKDFIEWLSAQELLQLRRHLCTNILGSNTTKVDNPTSCCNDDSHVYLEGA